MAKAHTHGSGWHKQSVRHSNARRTGTAGGKYSGRAYIEHKGHNSNGSNNYYYTLVPKKEKIDFLMKSHLHKREQLENMDDRTLNDFFKAGLEATGFKLRYQKDSDGDGVPDKYDCAPKDPHKQHTITRIKTADGTDTSDLSGEIQKALREKGYSAGIVVKNASRIDVKQVRLSDKGIEEMGYNVKQAEYTKSGQRRSRVPTWEQWEDINHTINDVLDKHKTFANIQSLGGKFKIRKGTERVDDWEDQKYENVGSIMTPVNRVDLYKQER